jgi:hypothetical protein
MYAMLIMIAVMPGGSATLQGYSTLDACKSDIPAVIRVYSELDHNTDWVSAKCIETHQADR